MLKRLAMKLLKSHVPVNGRVELTSRADHVVLPSESRLSSPVTLGGREIAHFF